MFQVVHLCIMPYSHYMQNLQYFTHHYMLSDLCVTVYLQEANRVDLESESEASLPEVSVGLSKMMQTDSPLAGSKLSSQEPLLVRIMGFIKPACICVIL